MITENVNQEQLATAVNEITAELLELISSFPDNSFYTIPFAGSWTAAQLYEHIIKSNKAIASALAATGLLTTRQPDLRVSELRDVFLSSTNKFQSPSSVLPDSLFYERHAVVEELEKLRKNIIHLTTTINNQETVDIPGFGELTKLELVYFIIYHTTRHLRQLQFISTILAEKSTTSS